MNLSVLYRGDLSSCNYACPYCPFSKRKETRVQLERDRTALSRFAGWLSSQTGHRWTILFTPWGEALIRRWYRQAVVQLSHQSHIDTLTVQTNLSCDVEWLTQCAVERVSLWATYHPTETGEEQFLQKVRRVWEFGIRICVGAVGVPDALPLIEQLKPRLPQGVYLWVNAQQPRRRPYTREETQRFESIDPQFSLSARRAPSLGQPCLAGEQTFTVDGRGDMRRCHFVDEIIGNCYESDWESVLQPRPCPNRFCNCFLGKSQLLRDELQSFFGSTVLSRLRNDG